jgi:hypothetical protein
VEGKEETEKWEMDEEDARNIVRIMKKNVTKIKMEIEMGVLHGRI